MMKEKKKEKRQKSIRSIKKRRHAYSQQMDRRRLVPTEYRKQNEVLRCQSHKTWKETASPLYLHDLLRIFYTIS
jgi:hypothetical protein